MRQVQSVSEFMDRFFDHAPAKQFMVGRKAIEFLTKPVSRDHGAGATYLRLAENESKNRDVEIDSCNSQNSPGV